VRGEENEEGGVRKEGRKEGWKEARKQGSKEGSKEARKGPQWESKFSHPSHSALLMVVEGVRKVGKKHRGWNGGRKKRLKSEC
jgi:hypothetical protein